MKKIFENVAFNIGFWASAVLFVLLNIISFATDKNSGNSSIKLSHGFDFSGFPFPAYAEGGYYFTRQVIWAGLIADITVGVVVSFVIGIVFKFVYSKIISRRFL